MQAFSFSPCVLAAALALCFPSFVQAQLGGKTEELGSGGRSFNDAKPDLAYDPVNDVYAHIFEGGSGPHSIRLKLFDAKTRSGISGGDTAMSTGTGDAINPCVSYNANTGLFLVAWQEDTSGNWDIMCRTYDPTTKTKGPVTTVVATAADEVTPDIAGDGTKATDSSVVVWDDEAVGIRGAEVDVPTLAVINVAAPKTLVAGGNPLHNNPALSRSGGAAGRVAMAWELDGSSLAVTAYAMDLTEASTPLTVPLTGSFPELDGDGSNFLVVFQRPDAATPPLGDIWCFSVEIPIVAQLPMTLVSAPSALATQVNDERHPTIAFVGGSYLAAWAVVNTNDQFGKCQIQTLTPDCSTCGAGWLLQFGNRDRTVDWQAVASAYNSDSSTNSRIARVMYDTGYVHATAGPRSLVQKVNYEVVSGPTTTIAPGCGAGGDLDFPSPFSFGEEITAQLSGADPTATNALFVAGVPGARSQFPCATCSVLIGPFVFGATVSAGEAQWSARIPCDPALNNLELDFQYVVITPNTSPCPLILPGLSTSNILRATLQ